jgi:hypothetical protein
MKVELTKKDISVVKRALILALVYRGHPNEDHKSSYRRATALRSVMDKIQKQFKEIPFFDEDTDENR